MRGDYTENVLDARTGFGAWSRLSLGHEFEESKPPGGCDAPLRRTTTRAGRAVVRRRLAGRRARGVSAVHRSLGDRERRVERVALRRFGRDRLLRGGGVGEPLGRSLRAPGRGRSLLRRLRPVHALRWGGGLAR